MRGFGGLLMAAVAGVLAMSGLARAGEVWTLEGKAHRGDVKLAADGGVMVGAVKVAAGDVLLATLREPAVVTVENPVPMNARGKDIGEVKVEGSESLSKGVYTIRGGGKGIGGMADSMRFLMHTLHGQSDIRARILDVRAGESSARGGIGIRANMSPEASEVLMLVDAGGNLTMVVRESQGAAAKVIDGGKVQMPVWVMVTRDGGKFAGLKSMDGKEWTEVGKASLVVERNNKRDGKNNIDYTGYAGMVVSGDSEKKAGTVMMDRVMSREPAAHPERPRFGTDGEVSAEWLSLPHEVTTPGLLLRDGTFLLGAQGGEVKGDKMDVMLPNSIGGGAMEVRVKEMQQLTFRDIPPDLVGNVPKDGVGLLLNSGDFVEGEFRGAAYGNVTVSSIVFGLQRFVIAERALAVMINGPKVDEESRGVTLAEGTVVMAEKMAVKGESVELEERVLGVRSVQAKEVYSVRAPLGKARSLTYVTPLKVEAPPHFRPLATSVFDTAGNSWLKVGDTGSDSGIVVAAGTKMTFDAEKGKSLVMRVGVPSRAMAKAAVRFVVRADGKELYRSESMTQAEGAKVVKVDLEGAEKITLELEGEEQKGTILFGLWGDVFVVR